MKRRRPRGAAASTEEWGRLGGLGQRGDRGGLAGLRASLAQVVNGGLEQGEAGDGARRGEGQPALGGAGEDAGGHQDRPGADHGGGGSHGDLTTRAGGGDRADADDG